MYATTQEALAHCRQDGCCIVCGEKFSNGNVFTQAGAQEPRISQTCERCFDDLFEDMDDEQ